MGILIVLILIIVGLFLFASSGNKEVEQQREAQVKKQQDRNARYHQRYNIPQNANVVKGIFNDISALSPYCGDKAMAMSEQEKQMYYFWKANSKINIVSKPGYNGIPTTHIAMFLDIDKISYYVREGSTHLETNIKGGGSSLGKAVVGGVIAGGAGAVVASRNKITSESKLVDNQKTVIVYEHNNNVVNIVLGSKAYDYLMQWIPNKEYKFVMSKTTEVVEKVESNNLADIETLAVLRDKGILTEEEFSAKKKQLLGIWY